MLQTNLSELFGQPDIFYHTHKINTQGSLTFLCTNNEKEIKESISFTNAIKKIIKHPGINLAKKTKELYTDNDKTLMKEITDNIKRWRDMPCS